MIFQVLVDRSETVNKCTILPLSYREDFEIVRFDKGQLMASLTGDLLLHPEGRPLQELSRRESRRIVAIDCTWKRLRPIVNRIEKPLPELAGIPEGFVTAYPRRNKKNLDPTAGLATIEALFIAAALLGHWDESLLAHYHFGQAFLDLNRDTFARYGVPPRALS